MVAGALALALGYVGEAGAVSIAYRATDLPDGGGLDLWKYEYFVSGGSFDTGFGFSILFPVGETQDLQPLPTPADADWDVIAIQPDPQLADDGRYDAQAKVDGATLGAAFAVQFHWLGAGAPGSQLFELYDPSFATIGTGETTPVPEPVTGALLGLGLAAVALARRVTS
jgi:hypothetical protein